MTFSPARSLFSEKLSCNLLLYKYVHVKSVQGHESHDGRDMSWVHLRGTGTHGVRSMSVKLRAFRWKMAWISKNSTNLDTARLAPYLQACHSAFQTRAVCHKKHHLPTLQTKETETHGKQKHTDKFQGKPRSTVYWPRRKWFFTEKKERIEDTGTQVKIWEVMSLFEVILWGETEPKWKKKESGFSICQCGGSQLQRRS